MIKLSLIVHIFSTADLRKGLNLVSVPMWFHGLPTQLNIIGLINII